MAKYILDPLIVDKTFGKWLLSRKFANVFFLHSQMSSDTHVMLTLQCVSFTEIVFFVHISNKVASYTEDILCQIVDQLKFSKNDFLETAQIFMPLMKRIVFHSLHPLTWCQQDFFIPKLIEEFAYEVQHGKLFKIIV